MVGGGDGHAMWPASDDCWRELVARYVPPVDRLPLLPFKTSFSVFSRVSSRFPAFRENQAALAYPQNRFGRDGQNTWKTLVYGFGRSGPLVPLDPGCQNGILGPTPGRLN